MYLFDYEGHDPINGPVDIGLTVLGGEVANEVFDAFWAWCIPEQESLGLRRQDTSLMVFPKLAKLRLDRTEDDHTPQEVMDMDVDVESIDENDDDDEEEVSGMLLVSNRPPPNQASTHRMKKRFACPYYVLDPGHNQTCVTRTDLLDIPAVKKHLWFDHRRPYYCPICTNTFETATQRDEHIRERRCGRADSPRPVGLTDDQLQLLACKAKPWKTAEEQWSDIWDIVVSGNDPRPPSPESPYACRREVEVLVGSLREYWAEHGDAHIANILEGREEILVDHDGDDGSDSLKRAVLHQLIDRLVGMLQHTEDIGRPVSPLLREDEEESGERIGVLRRLFSWN
jgi:hypothetical protein